MARNILILGASYGALMGAKVALAGHHATLVCRQRTADLINSRGILIHMPVKGHEALVPVHSHRMPGRVTATTPETADPRAYDLVVLAMCEPQYQQPGVRELMQAVAVAGVPCLSLMNMPPLPYLARVDGIETSSCGDSYTDASVWDGFDPNAFTMCSPDAQAFRPPESDGNVLEVRLPTNFKAARFASEAHNAVLSEIAQDIEDAAYEHGRDEIELPVKLKLHDSIFVPLAKWPMLMAGNYRCLMPEGTRSIESAVHADPESSRCVYEWVSRLCKELGARDEDLVPYDKYASAARTLRSPSSAARSLIAGAPHIERVDRLVQSLAAQRGMRHQVVDDTVACVDDWLVRNRMKG
jgi:hypothetical protein